MPKVLRHHHLVARPALAPHLAWPVSNAELRAALGDYYERVRVVRTQWDKQGSSDPLSVSWHAERAEMPGWSKDRTPDVWIRPIEREGREAVRELLLRDVLPDLARWLREAFEAPQTWRDTRHERRWSIKAGALVAHDDDGMHILDRERGRR
ncbi:MAG: hypothetical protein WC869_16800 [Phycisphaerae bacterium]